MDRFILARTERRWVIHDLELKTVHQDLLGMKEQVARAIAHHMFLYGLYSLDEEDVRILRQAAEGTGEHGGQAIIGCHDPDLPDGEG